MGVDVSSLFGGEKKKKKKGERFYKAPAKRLKERFDPEENLNFTSQSDASVDKVTEQHDDIRSTVKANCYSYLTSLRLDPLIHFPSSCFFDVTAAICVTRLPSSVSFDCHGSMIT